MSADKDEKDNDEFLLNTLKESYKYTLEWKKELDSKAFNLVLITGAISTFALTLVKESLLPSLFLFVSMIFAVLSYNVRKYTFVASAGKSADKKSFPSLEEVKEFFYSNPRKAIVINLIDSYADSIARNSKEYNKKAQLIKISQIFLIIAIGLFLIKLLFF